MQRRRMTACLLSLSVIVTALGLSGCSSYLLEHRANQQLAAGQAEEGLQLLQKLSLEHPQQYRLRYIQARDQVTARLLQEARQQETEQPATAASRYRQILAIDPGHDLARRNLDLLGRKQHQQELLLQARSALNTGEPEQARQLLHEILAETPNQPEALALRQAMDLDRNRQLLAEPLLDKSLRKPVSLEFRGASIQAVFDVLAQSAGINFIFDRDVKTDLKTTLYARNTRIEEALQLILRTNQLARKVLNENTLLIYPDTPDKQKQYDDLVIRSFYLQAADAKKMLDMVRTLINPKSMYVDDKLRMLVVRDSLTVVQAVEKLVSTYDIPDPEVILDVEVLEVSSDKLLNLGIQYPDHINSSLTGAAGKVGELAAGELTSLSRSNLKLTVADPLATFNFKQTSGAANLLANPKIRVRNREKAKILIGDKVPVVTTTTNQTSSSVSESVSYLDVGLKLEVEPEVHANADVSMTVGLEVSNIVKEVKSSTGLLTYQIGTRNASTVLRLQDGETQMLAGLIKKEQRDSASHLPGLGKLPWLGKLFSNESSTDTKTEIVLLITPHIVRSLHTPGAEGVEFASGTGNEVSLAPFRLQPATRLSATTANNNDSPTASSVAADSTDARSLASHTTNASEAPNTPSTTTSSPAIGLQLGLVLPAQVAVQHEFTVAVLGNGPDFESLEVDLRMDQPVLELLRSTVLVPSPGFSAQASTDGVHLHFGKTLSHSGPLALLTFRAIQATAQPVTLSLQDAQAQQGDTSALPTQTTDARTLHITP